MPGWRKDAYLPSIPTMFYREFNTVYMISTDGVIRLVTRRKIFKDAIIRLRILDFSYASQAGKARML